MVVLIRIVSHRVMDGPCVMIACLSATPLVLTRVVPGNGFVPVISTLYMAMTKFLSSDGKSHLLNEHMFDSMEI